MKQVEMICSIEGCGRKRFARGYCGRHYGFWHTYGDPLHEKQRREPGTGTLHDGYVRHRSGGKLVREHQLAVEKAYGKPLPPGSQIHHIDENKSNNVGSNLVLCPSDAYHKLLHLRQAALDACGNASFRKCQFCRQWDDPAGMKYNSRMFHHAACRSADTKRRYYERKAKGLPR